MSLNSYRYRNGLPLATEVASIRPVSFVNMFLTSKACPLVSNLSSRIRRRVEGLPGIRQAKVEALDEP